MLQLVIGNVGPILADGTVEITLHVEHEQRTCRNISIHHYTVQVCRECIFPWPIPLQYVFEMITCDLPVACDLRAQIVPQQILHAAQIPCGKMTKNVTVQWRNPTAPHCPASGCT